MSQNETEASNLPTGPSPLDLIVGFYQTVFTANDDETPEHKEQIKQLILQAFAEDYTFNGGTMKPIDLFNWRESFFDRFSKMAFRVHDVITGPISGDSDDALTAVAMAWKVDAIGLDGLHWRLEGMSLLSVADGKAVSNVQLGDASNGFVQVPN